MTEFFYDLFYILPLTIAVILNTVSYLGREEDCIAGCLFSFVLVVLILFIKHAEKKARYLVIGILFVLSISIWWILGEEKRAIMYDNYNWLWMFLAIVVIGGILGKLAENVLWIKIIISVALLGNGFYMMIHKISHPKAMLPTTMLVVMVYLVEIIQQKWIKSGYTDSKAHTVLVVPMLMLVCILATTIPTPDNPYNWNLAKKIWKMTVIEYKRFVGFINGNNEEYGYTGFSQNSSFNAGVSVNDKEVLYITYDKKNMDRLYLGGIIFDDFDGKKWTGDEKRESNNRILDLLETRCAIYKYNQGYEREYIKENVIDVESRRYNTKYIFTPLKVNLDSEKSMVPKYKETQNNILSSSRLRYGDSYSMAYIQVNNNNPELPMLIDGADAIEKEEWDFVIRKSLVGDTKSCSYKKYLEYKDSIYDKYAKSNGMSEEISEIVAEVTNGIEGDYEKLKAIEAYLQTFEYSTAPGQIPETVNDAKSFLDYFMLETKKGYCVHYATAFVLLARECGYPARYVQGYYIKRGDGEGVTVTEKNAHSWAEVYFDNYGWVTFEATPGFRLSKGWVVQGRVDASKDMIGASNTYENAEDKHEREESENVTEKKSFNYWYIIIPVSVVILFVTIYMFIFRIVTARRYEAMNNDEKFAYMTHKTLRVLNVLGYHLKEDETFDEYRMRVANDLNEDKLVMALSFISQYEKQIYADYKVNEENVLLVEESYRLYKEMLRTKGIKYRLLFDFI